MAQADLLVDLLKTATSGDPLALRKVAEEFVLHRCGDVARTGD